MNRIRYAHHTGLTVRSLDQSLNFYRDILGFELVFRWNPQADYLGRLVGYPNVDLHAAVLRLPGSDLFLELLEYGNVDGKPVDTANGNPGTAHVAFAVDDLDALYADLTALGVGAVSSPVTPTIGPNRGGRAVYMIDPDGFRVEFIQTARRFDEYSEGEKQPPAGCC